jgi:hypothetical protein
MSQRTLSCALMVLALALLSCSAPKSWERIDTTKSTKEGVVSVHLPTGWVQALRATERTVITKDGLPIQLIEISCRPKDQAFPLTKQAPADGALPSDVAALYLAELRSRSSLGAMVVQENLPAMVADEDGFKIQMEWRNSQGVRYSGLVYGALVRGQLLTLTYMAIHVHYFERDLPEFEKLVASCKAMGN